MRRFLGAALMVALLYGPVSPAHAEGNKDAGAILDKAIKALGGEEKLSKIKAATWKAKGTIHIGDNENDFTSQVTVQGVDQFRQDFEVEFNGNKVKGTTVLNGDKGWRKFGDMGGELNKDQTASQKRGAYLQVIPITLLPLKGKDFKVKAAGEEKVGDKAAVVLTITPPDGKEFKLYFDKESGLPVKQVAKVAGFMGEEVNQETTYGGYKELGGIKKATKIESQRDGKKFLDQEITEFKVLDKVDAKTFAEPE
jgi:hypothetical protein